MASVAAGPAHGHPHVLIHRRLPELAVELLAARHLPPVELDDHVAAPAGRPPAPGSSGDMPATTTPPPTDSV